MKKELEARFLGPSDRTAVDEYLKASHGGPRGDAEAFLVETEDDLHYWIGAFAEDGRMVGVCSIGEDPGYYAVEKPDDANPDAPSWDDHRTWILGDVNVLGNERGKGHGTRLVEAAIRLAKAEGAGRLVADIIDDELHYFYRRLGFRYVDENTEVHDLETGAEEGGRHA